MPDSFEKTILLHAVPRWNNADEGPIMNETITLTIDGVEINGTPDQSILEAADTAGIYIPHLCFLKGLVAFGSCRVCTVMINGRPQSACTQPIAEGMVVENDTPELLQVRRDMIDMLFVEGNHFCMFCEKSGACELQALAHRFGISAPRFQNHFPAEHEVNVSHPDITLDRNRCILCARCVRASCNVDGKGVYGFNRRGRRKRLSVDAPRCLAETSAAAMDAATRVCPVGCIILKRTAHAVPIGKRPYDHTPVGSEDASALSTLKREMG